MMIGRIKNVRAIEGYAFIACEDGIDRFAHHSACVGMTLSDTLVGLYVAFEPALAPRGPRAVHVTLLSNTPATGIPLGTRCPAMTEPAVGDAETRNMDGGA